MTIRRRQAPTNFGASGDAAEPLREAAPTEPLIAPAAEAAPAAPLQPPPLAGEVTTSPPRPVARRPGKAAAPEGAYATPSGWPIYLLALVISVLWALAPIAYAFGYRRAIAPFNVDAFAIGVFALLAIGPAVFVWGAAYMIRQGQKLAAESRRAKAMAEEMLAPALTAAARSGHVVQGIRDEIQRAGEAADAARETLLALRQAIAAEAETLVDATRSSVRTAQELAGTLGRERAELGQLAQTLDVQAARVVDAVAEQARTVVQATETAEGQIRQAEAALARTLDTHTAQVNETISEQARAVTDAAAGAEARLREAQGSLSQSLDGQAAKITETIGQQARMVADAAEVAESQLKEAESALAARAADLVAAAGEAGDAARTAGEDLVRHIARLESAGTGVAEQVRAVEGGLSEQRQALITLAQALRGDHEAFAAEAEAHAAKLSEFISQARLSAAEMSDRAAKGGETLKGLMADAAEQFRDLAETARAEREEFGQSTVQSLDAVSQAAARERAELEAQTRAAIEALHRAAEETREAAARHATTAREQVDQLSEAAFTAGQKANEVFEKRLEEARALVEQSSKMVDEAGAATARRLDEGAAAARATLTELEAMMGELEARAASLPVAARGQVDAVRSAVEHGIDALMDAARRTAEEAQAIDVAFQERVRRNFEMLSEAVRLMGSAAAAPPPLAAASPPPRPPATPPVQRAPMASFSAAYVPKPPPAPAPEPEAEEPDLELDDLVEPAPAPAGKAAKPAAAETPLAQRLGLRPRLKLTPTATDEEFSQVFEAAGGPPPAAAAKDNEGWGWKDLLASIDGGEADPAALEKKLTAELGEMGVDPAKLLLKARVDEVAAAVQTGDMEGARKVVRRLAPAATRRISRRLAGDDDLRRRVEGYLSAYQPLVQDAAVKDPEGFAMAELLASPGGRLFLLIDAAAGDMA
ncbi:polar localization protein TipN [Phenylobacterium sp.]|jgi:hypothetical protein|uniref:polar localization protein TipN n=1 Tax=Phenylobacterium sp. TaxID=1871053 RepID=UPI002F93C4F5